MGWTHQICEACWQKREPGRVPTKVIEAEPGHCCFCGERTMDGIWVREDPKKICCFEEH